MLVVSGGAARSQLVRQTIADATGRTVGIPETAEIRRKRNLLILGIVLTLPVVILNMFFMNRFPGENFLLLALTTPIWAVVGWEFHRGAIKTLRLPL